MLSSDRTSFSTYTRNRTPRPLSNYNWWNASCILLDSSRAIFLVFMALYHFTLWGECISSLNLFYWGSHSRGQTFSFQVQKDWQTFSPRTLTPLAIPYSPSSSKSLAKFLYQALHLLVLSDKRKKLPGGGGQSAEEKEGIQKKISSINVQYLTLGLQLQDYEVFWHVSFLFFSVLLKTGGKLRNFLKFDFLISFLVWLAQEIHCPHNIERQ